MTQPALSERVRGQFPQWVIATHQYCGDQTVILRPQGLLEVCRWLRDDPGTAFAFLMDLTCVDYLRFGSTASSAPLMASPSPLPYFMRPKRTTEVWQRGVEDASRFELVYHLYSPSCNHRLRLKVPLAAEDLTVQSLTSLWKSADWFEREVWDMFGIRFVGHPNLKRILMYEPFDGHPLRKDYPVNKRQPLLGPVN